MMQPDGSFKEIETDASFIIQRIAAAGNREVPIYAAGEEVELKGGRFRVLAFGGKILVLEALGHAVA